MDAKLDIVKSWDFHINHRMGIFPEGHIPLDGQISPDDVSTTFHSFPPSVCPFSPHPSLSPPHTSIFPLYDSTALSDYAISPDYFCLPDGNIILDEHCAFPGLCSVLIPKNTAVTSNRTISFDYCIVNEQTDNTHANIRAVEDLAVAVAHANNSDVEDLAVAVANANNGDVEDLDVAVTNANNGAVEDLAVAVANANNGDVEDLDVAVANARNGDVEDLAVAVANANNGDVQGLVVAVANANSRAVDDKAAVAKEDLTHDGEIIGELIWWLEKISDTTSATSPSTSAIQVRSQDARLVDRVKEGISAETWTWMRRRMRQEYLLRGKGKGRSAEKEKGKERKYKKERKYRKERNFKVNKKRVQSAMISSKDIGFKDDLEEDTKKWKRRKEQKKQKGKKKVRSAIRMSSKVEAADDLEFEFNPEAEPFVPDRTQATLSAHGQMHRFPTMATLASQPSFARPFEMPVSQLIWTQYPRTTANPTKITTLPPHNMLCPPSTPFTFPVQNFSPMISTQYPRITATAATATAQITTTLPPSAFINFLL